jgi:hypothetical protein
MPARTTRSEKLDLRLTRDAKRALRAVPLRIATLQFASLSINGPHRPPTWSHQSHPHSLHQPPVRQRSQHPAEHFPMRLQIDQTPGARNRTYLFPIASSATRATSFYTHPTMARRLRMYLTQRPKALAGRPVRAFFMNRCGKHLNYNAQPLTFLRLLKSAGIQAVPGERGPSLHSFRHSFAVRRLTLWHRERRDVQQLLAHFAVYLGHVGPENTYWCLSGTPELLH